MKLQCEVVTDLYVLYKEKELSPDVNKAVNEHLKECKQCSLVYESGSGFSDHLMKDAMIEPSIKLDEKLILRLRLRRLKVVLAFVLSIFIMYNYFQYIDDRRGLLYEVSNTEQIINEIRFALMDVKTDYHENQLLSFTQIESLNKQFERMKRNFNFMEKNRLNDHPYRLNIHFTLANFVDLLHIKFRSETWSDRDERALTEMQTYIEDYLRLLTDERLKLNGLYDSFDLKARFVSFNTEELLSLNQKIDQLSYTYYHEQKFPEEMELMKKDDVKNEVKTLFNAPSGEILLQIYTTDEVLKAYGSYDFQLTEEGRLITGSVDAYTGQVRTFHNHSEKLEGELIQKEVANKALKEFLNKFFGKDIEPSITDLGINYNYSSNVDIKLYSYKVIPFLNNYPINMEYLFYLDGRTGEVISNMTINGQHSLHKNAIFSPVEMNISKDTATHLLKNKQGQEINGRYLETTYIKTISSGNYELVHVIQLDEKDAEFPFTRYVNTRTGKEEIQY